MLRIVYISVGDGGSDVALLSLIDNIDLEKIEPIVIINRYAERGLRKELLKRSIRFKFINYDFDLWPKLSKPLMLSRYIFFIYKRFLLNRIAVKKLITFSRKNRIHLIHSNTGAIQLGYKAAKRLNIPHVWHLREYLDLDFDSCPILSKKSFMRKLNSEWNYNIAITNGVYNHFKLGNNSTLIYDGVFSPDQIRFLSKKEKYFLFVGRLTEGKGITELISSFIEFKNRTDSDYILKLVGSYTKRVKDRLEMMIHSSNLLNQVQFLGYQENVFDLMASATALIVPSKFEAFGLITCEAMVNGCLVIGKDTSGTQEQFDNGLKITGKEIGLRYKTNFQLIQILIDISFNGIKKYEPIIQNAQIAIRSLYTKSQNSQLVTEVYNKLIENNGGINHNSKF